MHRQGKQSCSIIQIRDGRTGIHKIDELGRATPKIENRKII